MALIHEDAVKLGAAIAQWRRASGERNEITTVQHFCRVVAEDATAEARDAARAEWGAEIAALKAEVAAAGAQPTPEEVKAARKEGFAAGMAAAKRKYTNLR